MNIQNSYLADSYFANIKSSDKYLNRAYNSLKKKKKEQGSSGYKESD